MAEGVHARCANCDSPVGSFQNRWKQITNSYYVHGDLGWDDSSKSQSLRPKGPPKEPGGSNKEFEGCLIQPLECPSCSETLGFRCLRARSDKLAYNGHVFYRLSKLRLFNPVDQEIEPAVDRASSGLTPGDSPARQRSPALLSSITTSPEPTRNERLSMPPTNNYGDFARADKEAIEGTNNGALDWQEAHENWTHITRCTMSPAAFAKRIIDFGGGRRVKQFGVRGQQPPSSRAPLNGILQPTNSASPRAAQVPPQSSSHYHQITRLPPPPPEQLPPIYGSTASNDSPAQHRRDMDRLEQHLMALQRQVDIMSQAIDRLGRQRGDADSYELLAETVSKLSSEMGDVNGLRLGMDSLKRRLRRLEETSNMSPPAPSEPISHPTYGGSRNDDLQQPSAKRQRISELHNNNSYIRLSPAINPPAPAPALALAPAPAPLQPRLSQEASKKSYPRYSPMPTTKPVLAPLAREIIMSTQDADSQASWRPLGRLDLPNAKKRGRPRKYDSVYTPPEQMSIQPWDMDSQEAETGMSPYYHTLQSADRGRVIRRGSGGGIGDSMKRTRQKPIRNAEGVLLRKDGKPDLRSISSPLNLRKTFAKRKEISEHRASSMSQQSDQLEGDVVRDSTQTSVVSEPTQEQKPPRRASSGHDAVMKQMFPRGVDDDAKRLNHAAHLFSTNRSPEREKVLPRKEMQREEIAEERRVSPKADSGVSSSAAVTNKMRNDDGDVDGDSTMADAPTKSPRGTTTSVNGTIASEKPQTPTSTPVAAAANVLNTQPPEPTGEKPTVVTATVTDDKSAPTALAVKESQESYRPEASSESGNTL